MSENRSENSVQNDSKSKRFYYDLVSDFLNELRLAGFRIGTQEYIDFQKVLATLVTDPKNNVEIEQLNTYLAPIVCTTPQEQSQFNIHFKKWLKQQGTPLAMRQAKYSENDDEGKVVERESLFKKYKRSAVAFALLIILLSLPTVYYAEYYHFTNITGGDDLYKSIGNIEFVKGRILDKKRFAPISSARIVVKDDPAGSNQPIIISPNGKIESEADGRFSFIYRSAQKTPEIEVRHRDYKSITQMVNPVGGEQVLMLEKRPERTSGSPGLTEGTLTIIRDSEAIETPWQRFYRNYIFYLIVLALFIIATCFGSWLLKRYIQRNARFKKRSIDETPNLNKLIAKSVTEQFYKDASLRKTIQELRRHRPQITDDLNIPETVDETINLGGLLKPVYGSRKISPEYLVLIDRVSLDDQQALLEDVLVTRLVEEGVYVDRYFFNQDPRVCYQEKNSKRFSLPELAARYPDHNLAIFSEGRDFLDPFAAGTQLRLEMLSYWMRRALLTPASTDTWGYRELILSDEADLPILPANKEGLDAFVDVVSLGQIPQVKLEKRPRKYPEILEDIPRRWLAEDPPGTDEIDELYGQLRRYLSAEEFYLLCACAVYPVLSFELTLYLGYHLNARKIERLENELFSLLRLPWFRFGTMPDWLRKKLISHLPDEQEQNIHEIIEKLLVTAIKNPARGITLDVTADELDPSERKKELRDFVLSEPESSPVRDYVCLSYLARTPLTVRVPEALRQMLFPKGIYWFGLRPLIALTGALLISLLLVLPVAYYLWQQMPPVIFDEPTISYSPTSGKRGNTYLMNFRSNDCEAENLNNVTLSSDATPGITIISDQRNIDCGYTATMVVSGSADIGDNTLELKRNGEIVVSFPFIIEESVEIIKPPVEERKEDTSPSPPPTPDPKEAGGLVEDTPPPPTVDSADTSSGTGDVPTGDSKDTDVDKTDSSGDSVGTDTSDDAPTATAELSIDKFNKIELGMSYDQVKEIIGSVGEETSNSTIGKLETKSYRWNGDKFASLYARFENDKLITKTQSNISERNGTADLTRDKYARLKTGMSYREVADIIGSEGEMSHISKIGEATMTNYRWKGPKYQIIITSFKNDLLQNLSNAGLSESSDGDKSDGDKDVGKEIDPDKLRIITPDGKYYFVNEDGKSKVVEMSSYKVVLNLEGESMVVAFSPDNKLLATVMLAEELDTVDIFDISTGRLVRQIVAGDKEISRITSINFGAKGQTLEVTYIDVNDRTYTETWDLVSTTLIRKN